MEKNSLLEKGICPKCSKRLDAATSLEDDQAKPQPGDCTVCFYCSSLLTYNSDYSLKELSEADMKKLDPQVQDSLLTAQKAIKQYHQKNPML